MPNAKMGAIEQFDCTFNPEDTIVTIPPAPPASSSAPGGPVPLWAPYYDAPIGVAVRRFFAKFYTFSGRASRAEFWWWFLVSFIITAVLNGILNAVDGGRVGADSYMSVTSGATIVAIIVGLWGLFTIIPTLSLLARRLHDTDRSGYWMFIGLIPLIGQIVLLVFVLTAPNPAGARFDRPTS